MKKIIFIVGTAFFLFSGIQFSQADDSSDIQNESLIYYYHKNREGKNVRDLYGTYEDMPPEVQKEPKECWWNYNGQYSCHPLKQKKKD